VVIHSGVGVAIISHCCRHTSVGCRVAGMHQLSLWCLCRMQMMVVVPQQAAGGHFPHC